MRMAIKGSIRDLINKFVIIILVKINYHRNVRDLFFSILEATISGILVWQIQWYFQKLEEAKKISG